MTAPVTATPSAARPASTAPADGGRTSSAAPFASALGGALADGHRPVGDVTSGGGRGRKASGETDPGNAGADDEAPAAVDTGAASVAAALWALALGGTSPGTPGATGQATAALARSGPGAVPAAGGPVLPATAASAAGEAARDLPTAVPAAATPAGVLVVPVAVPADVAAAAGGPSPAPGPASAGSVPATMAPTPADAATVSGAHPAAPVPPAPPDAPPSAGTTGPAPAVDAPADVATDVPDPVPTAAGTAPAVPAAGLPVAVGETDAATGTAASLPVSGQVARQVAVLSGAGDGSHTMTMVLTPDNLGPVEVRITVREGSLDLTLRGAHDLGRAALMDALPELRRDLEAAGLSPSRVEVDADADAGGSWLARHTAEQQAGPGSGDRGRQQDDAGDRSRSWGRPADSGEGRPRPPATGSTSSGVDLRV